MGTTWGFFIKLGLGLIDSTWGDRPDHLGAALRFVDLGNIPGSNPSFPLEPKAVFAGLAHTCVLLSGLNWVKCWGANDDGQLGLGDVRLRGRSPADMGDALPFISVFSSLTRVDAVAVGDNHTCFLASNSVKCWGANGSGQLGLGDRASRGSNPSSIPRVLPAVDLGAGNAEPISLFLGGDRSCALLARSEHVRRCTFAVRVRLRACVCVCGGGINPHFFNI